MKTIVIRADSNTTIASGHIMRCLSIAGCFRDIGIHVLFVTADGNSDELLVGKEFEHINLHSSWDNLSKEIPQMVNLLQNNNNPLLLIDTYSITADYVDALSPYATIAYLGSKRGYLGHLDYQINYSAKTEPDYYRSLYGESIKLMLGLSYTPLRKEFQNIPLHCHPEINHILITTGNTDTLGYVPKILNALLSLDVSKKIVYDVVVGRMFGFVDELEKIASENSNVLLHRNVTKMSDLMVKSDLAITACGNTILELAAAKVPQLAFSMVEEQVRSAKEFSELGMIDYCGEIYSDIKFCLDNICDGIIKYYHSFEARWELIKKAASQVDGRGCERIVRELLNKQ